jgi:hypothetical protein
VLPKEVLIGNDDNNNFISEEKLRNLFNLPISVINRNISLGQAKNVDDLIQRANSQWLMIIHDDDLLISNSLEKFFSYIDKDNENNVYFGMQKLLEKNRLHTDHEGIDFNNKFHRNINLNNSSSFDIVSNQSLPSNGFIINTNRAKQIGYTYHIEFNNYGIIKDACDYSFSWKCFKNNLNFKFLPIFTTIYRITEGSVSNSKNITILESALTELDVFLNFDLNNFQKTAIQKKFKKRCVKSLKTCVRIQQWSLLSKLFLLTFD